MNINDGENEDGATKRKNDDTDDDNDEDDSEEDDGEEDYHFGIVDTTTLTTIPPSTPAVAPANGLGRGGSLTNATAMGGGVSRVLAPPSSPAGTSTTATTAISPSGGGDTTGELAIGGGGGGKSKSKSKSQGQALETEFGIFLLGKPLGRGASATVFRAMGPQGRLFAVKKFKKRYVESNKEDIDREVQLMQKLSHPNIIEVVGMHELEGHIFLILDYAEGGTLLNLLEEFKKLSEGIVSVFIKQVILGLQYLHEREIVHRDIKASNCLVKEGIVKVADFGISRALEDQKENFSAAGSPYWMAPEVIQGICTPASDICFISNILNTQYKKRSLGITTIELLDGVPPFHEFNHMQAMFKIIQSDIPIPASASPELKDFLSSCLQKEPTDRLSASALSVHPWFTKGDTISRKIKKISNTKTAPAPPRSEPPSEVPREDHVSPSTSPHLQSGTIEVDPEAAKVLCRLLNSEKWRNSSQSDVPRSAPADDTADILGAMRGMGGAASNALLSMSQHRTPSEHTHGHHRSHSHTHHNLHPSHHSKNNPEPSQTSPTSHQASENLSTSHTHSHSHNKSHHHDAQSRRRSVHSTTPPITASLVSPRTVRDLGSQTSVSSPSASTKTSSHSDAPSIDAESMPGEDDENYTMSEIIVPETGESITQLNEVEQLRAKLDQMRIQPTAMSFVSIKPHLVYTLEPTCLPAVPVGRVWCLIVIDGIIWVGGNGGLVSLWDSQTFEVVSNIKIHKTRIYAMVQLKDKVFVSSEESAVWIVNSKTLKRKKAVVHDAEHSMIRCLAVDDTIISGKKRIWSCAPSNVTTQVSIFAETGKVTGRFAIDQVINSVSLLGPNVWLGCYDLIRIVPSNAAVPLDTIQSPRSSGPINNTDLHVSITEVQLHSKWRVTSMIPIGDYMLVSSGRYIFVISTEGKEMLKLVHDNEVTRLCLFQNLVLASDFGGTITCYDPTSNFKKIHEYQFPTTSTATPTPPPAPSYGPNSTTRPATGKSTSPNRTVILPPGSGIKTLMSFVWNDVPAFWAGNTDNILCVWRQPKKVLKLF